MGRVMSRILGLALVLFMVVGFVSCGSGGGGGGENPRTLAEIQVDPTNPDIAKGTTQQFAATAIYSDVSHAAITNVVTWRSSDDSIATVSNASESEGLATCVGEGAVTLSAAFAAISGSTTLTCTPAVLVSVAVAPASGPASPTIPNGLDKQFVAIGTFSDSSTQNLTDSVDWSSSNTSVATVSEGLATSTGMGSTNYNGHLYRGDPIGRFGERLRYA